MKATKKNNLIVFVCVCVMVASIVLAVFFVVAQRAKCNTVNLQIEQYQQRSNKLAIEENRLMLMHSYVRTKAYAVYYAREHLGYLDEFEVYIDVK